MQSPKPVKIRVLSVSLKPPGLIGPFPGDQPERTFWVATMADDATKKRTFRKFTYRGVDLEQLLDLNTDELVQLFHARARRK